MGKLLQSLFVATLNSPLGAWMLNRKIRDYGRMNKLEIDTKDRVISIIADLKGEASAIEVIIEGYEISYAGSNGFLQAKAASASREWVSVLLQHLLVENKLQIPADQLNLAERILA